MGRIARTAVALAAAAGLVVAGGCGPAEAKYYDVTGTVTFGGKPVPKGTLSFEPHPSKGVKGMAGHADLVDGKFTTKGKGGKGVLGGAYIVRVLGFDGKAAYEAPYGTALFGEYTLDKDFPKEDSNLDVDVKRK